MLLLEMEMELELADLREEKPPCKLKHTRMLALTKREMRLSPSGVYLALTPFLPAAGYVLV